jgi:hypothetical protein
LPRRPINIIHTRIHAATHTPSRCKTPPFPHLTPTPSSHIIPAFAKYPNQIQNNSETNI